MYRPTPPEHGEFRLEPSSPCPVAVYRRSSRNPAPLVPRSAADRAASARQARVVRSGGNSWTSAAIPPDADMIRGRPYAALRDPLLDSPPRIAGFERTGRAWAAAHCVRSMRRHVSSFPLVTGLHGEGRPPGRLRARLSARAQRALRASSQLPVLRSSAGGGGPSLRVALSVRRRGHGGRSHGPLPPLPPAGHSDPATGSHGRDGPVGRPCDHQGTRWPPTGGPARAP